MVKAFLSMSVSVSVDSSLCSVFFVKTFTLFSESRLYPVKMEVINGTKKKREREREMYFLSSVRAKASSFSCTWTCVSGLCLRLWKLYQLLTASEVFDLEVGITLSTPLLLRPIYFAKLFHRPSWFSNM